MPKTYPPDAPESRCRKPTSGRSGLLSPDRPYRNGRVTQSRQPPVNPARFTAPGLGKRRQRQARGGAEIHSGRAVSGRVGSAVFRCRAKPGRTSNDVGYTRNAIAPTTAL